MLLPLVCAHMVEPLLDRVGIVSLHTLWSFNSDIVQQNNPQPLHAVLLNMQCNVKYLGAGTKSDDSIISLSRPYITIVHPGLDYLPLYCPTELGG